MPLTDDDRRARIEDALEAHAEENGERLRLPWRSGSELFPVVELPLDTLLLNPRSHRIRAQLESHPGGEVVERDPWSQEAQDILADILRDLGRFDALVTNLGAEGQQHPGVVTRAGVLVNANRRAVALRDLGAEYLRVAVLPLDARTEEVDGLELRLQMQVDFREDYTFTNRLLFVDELIAKQNRSADYVARALNVAASSDPRQLAKGRAKVDQDTRVLQMIREIQQRSGNKLPLTSFDDKEIAMEELDNRLRELEDNPLAQKAVYELRLLGLLSDVPYRDLRPLDHAAIERNVLPLMQEEDDPLGAILDEISTDTTGEGPSQEPSGLEVLEEAEEAGGGGGEAKLSALNNVLSQSHGDDDVVVPTSDGETRRVEREPLVEQVNRALRGAAQEIKDAGRQEDMLRAPTRRVAEAERKLRSALEALEALDDRAGFDSSGLAAALARAQERLTELAEAAGVELDS